MDDGSICVSYVNMPSRFYVDLIERGFFTRSRINPTDNKTICVKLDPNDPKYYPILPDYGEAIVETLEELDTLIMLKGLRDDAVIREYIKTTHEVYGMADD